MPEPEVNEVNEKAAGGTELLMERLYNDVDSKLLDNFQIIPSRVRDITPNKKNILYLHDLPDDPESKHLANEGWRKFDKLVYVSEWQKDMYQISFNIPPSHGIVIKNSIIPIENHEKPDTNKQINLIYHTTPHRGLEILVPVFIKMTEQFTNIHLDVYSSFNAYGWPNRDRPYEHIFEQCRNHDKITYHGFKPNDVIREALKKAHIFAYPNIWPETSCLSLIEAMSAGLICIHPNFAALPETASNLTFQYNHHEDPSDHANIFMNKLYGMLSIMQMEDETSYNHIQTRVDYAKNYVDSFCNWQSRKHQWIQLLENMLDG